MKAFIFQLRITAENWTEYYRTPGASVVAYDVEGRKIKLAARHLQKHITRDGISGTFELRIDQGNNFVSLERLAPKRVA